MDAQPVLFPAPLEPRPYQQRVADRVVELLAGGAQSVLVESPTGSGKTVMGLAVASHLQRGEGLTVGWCAMRRNLLAQAAEANRRAFGVEMRLISMFDKSPPHVDLLVIDEAQHDGALSMANLHGAIRPRYIVGLSATPFRSDRFKLCFQATVRDAGIHALIGDGYLSPYHHYTVPRYDPLAVAEHFARDPARWGRTLIFFHRLADCRECQRHLCRLGVACEVVTAASDREAQIEAFERGDVPVLLAMLILAEGFDCPALQTVFCRPSGRLCTVQMCGRVLRKHPSLPFKQIVQCEQTGHPFPRSATPAEQYLWSSAEGSWQSLKMNRQIEAVCRRMERVIAASEVKLPKLLTVQPPGAGRPSRRRSWQRELAPFEIDPDREVTERDAE